MQSGVVNLEVETAAFPKPGIAAKIFSGFFSYLFHPVFIPIYVTFFLLYIHPSAFSGFSEMEKRQTVLIVLLNLVFFPLVSVLLLKAVGFIDSLFLRTQKDRIIPYIASGIFFSGHIRCLKSSHNIPFFLRRMFLEFFLHHPLPFWRISILK